MFIIDIHFTKYFHLQRLALLSSSYDGESCSSLDTIIPCLPHYDAHNHPFKTELECSTEVENKRRKAQLLDLFTQDHYLGTIIIYIVVLSTDDRVCWDVVPKRHSLHEVGMLQHLHKSCLHNLFPHRWWPDSVFLGKPPVAGCLCSSQKRGTSSQILARRHTQTHSSHMEL